MGIFPKLGSKMGIFPKLASTLGSDFRNVQSIHHNHMNIEHCESIPSPKVGTLKNLYVIGQTHSSSKGQIHAFSHHLSIFPELFSFSGFMKNRLSHYHYSFLQLFGQGFFPLFSSLSLILFLSSSCFFLLGFSPQSHSFSYHSMKQTRLL